MNVELLGYYGGDKTHAMSAWTSTTRDYEKKKERMPALLEMLAREGHHTPFEKSMLHFLVRCDTASHIHFLKHRIGVSVNAESARYKQLRDPTPYIPEDWPEVEREGLKEYFSDAVDYYRFLIDKLVVEQDFSMARAKESARFVLPYANELNLDVSFNFRSFMHFQKLRNSPHAQLEIRTIAETMLDLVRDLEDFHYSLMAFGVR